MKRIIAVIAILVVALGIGVGYMIMSGRHVTNGGTSTQSTSSGKYTYAKADPITVTGIGGYQLGSVDLGDGAVPLITIPLDSWGGYAAIFNANKGSEPNKESLFYKKGHFAVKLTHIESATEQRNGYASGRYPIIWAPTDSLPSLYDGFKIDKRITPKVLTLLDWSTGGDGIIVRDNIKNPSDLKGKTVLTSSNTPYSFMLLWYLAQVGLNGTDVNVVWIDDGDKALETFHNDKNIAAWVTWTPYLTDVTTSGSKDYIDGTRLLISSKDANQLIADTLIVRNDLFNDKPDMMKAFIESITEATQSIDTSTYNYMASFYKISASEAKDMLSDVHIATFPEIKMFFSMDNQIGYYMTFSMAQEYYKQIGAIAQSSNYDPSQVYSSKLIESLDVSGKFKDQKNTIIDSFNKTAAAKISDLEDQREVLKKDIKLNFEAQKLDFDVNSSDEDVVKNMEMLKEVAKESKILGTTMIQLIGNLDTSKVEELKKTCTVAQMITFKSLARMLSLKRAEFIKSILVKKYGISEDRILAARS